MAELVADAVAAPIRYFVAEAEAADADVAVAEAVIGGFTVAEAVAVDVAVVAAEAEIAPNAENALVANARDENATAMLIYAQTQEGLEGYTR